MFGVCLFVGLYYAVRSTGTYQDDDIDHYFLAVQALRDPALFLDRWGMPGFTLAIALPARLFGYLGVEVFTAVASAGAAAAAAWTARRLGIAHPWLAGGLTFFQPIALELCHSGLAEPLAALLLAVSLAFWYAGRPDRALFAAGWLPLVRIEAGFLLAVLLAVGWSRASWPARIGAVLPSALWNFGGFLLTGELLYILVPGQERPLNSLGAFHYARNLVVVAGPVVVFFLVWAVAARVHPVRRREARFPALAAGLAAGHLVVLSLLAWESLPFGRSIGFLRHAVVLAPVFGLLAAWGFHDWSSGSARPRFLRAGLSVLWAGAVAVGLSHTLLAHSLVVEGRAEGRWIVTAVLAAAGGVLLFRPAGARLRRALAVALGVGMLGAGLGVVRPVGLDAERRGVLEAVEYLRKNDLDSRKIYTNHPWFAFLTGRDRYDLETTPRLTLDALDHAPPGSLVLWENHYGPRLYGDVPIDTLRADPRFERILELSGGRFRLVMFHRREDG